VADDDLRFTPPGPKTGSHLRVSAVRAPGGELVTDAIVDDGQTAPRKFKTLDEVRAFIGGAGTKAAIFPCHCAVVLGDDDSVLGYDPCKEHLKKLTG